MTAPQTIINTIADMFEADMRWGIFAKSTLAHERKLKPALRKVFKLQREEVEGRVRAYGWMAQVRSTKAMFDPWLFNSEDWDVRLENAARPYLEDSMREGYTTASADIVRQSGTVWFHADFNVRDPHIAELLADKLHKFSFSVNDTTLKLLKAEFAEALARGEAIRAIQERVGKVFKFTSKVRTERIARTEIIGTANRGNFEAMLASGVVKTKKWRATRDARTRDAHRHLDGEEVPVRAKFSNGLVHPGDWDGPAEEIINCRCTMVHGKFVGE